MAKETKEDLTYRLEAMQEKLYEANIEPRPTIMQKIIDREAELFNHIKYCIEDCEKETGRPVDIYSLATPTPLADTYIDILNKLP